jgi:hypothetical protein
MVSLLLPLVLCFADIAAPDVQFKQPQLASQGRSVAMVFGGGNTIYYSGSSDSGTTFSAPVAVAQTAALLLGNHRGPRIAFAGDAIVITASVGIAPAAGASGHGAHGGPEQLLSWRSTNGGKTWTAGPRVTPSSGEGFHALASEGKNRLREVWMVPVDGRVKILGAHSDDSGLSWSEPQAIYQSPDKNVCECCHPSLALGADGEILVMFRNSIAGARDLYLARSKDGASFTAAKLGEGTWPLKACPMDGGGIAVGDGGIVTVWRRNTDIFLARPGEAEKKIGEGRNPAVAIGKNGVYSVWSAVEGLMASVPRKSEPYVLSKSGGFPAISGGTQVVVAREDGGQIRTARLD